MYDILFWPFAWINMNSQIMFHHQVISLSKYINWHIIWDDESHDESDESV